MAKPKREEDRNFLFIDAYHKLLAASWENDPEKVIEKLKKIRRTLRAIEAMEKLKAAKNAETKSKGEV